MGKSNWSKEYLSTIESVRFMHNFNSEGETDYLTALLDDRVIVFKNDKIICEKVQDDKYITGKPVILAINFFIQKKAITKSIA